MAKGNLLSGKTGKSLVALIRSDYIIAGNKIEIASRTEDGTFLRRKTSSVPTPPTNCCLYPWPDPNGDRFDPPGPLYPATDLPDKIFYDSVEFDNNGAYEFVATTDYPLPSYRAIIGTRGDDGWKLWHPNIGIIDSSSCLIGEWETHTATDNFSDTYTIDGSITLTRTSLCIWEGDNDVGDRWTLGYDAKNLFGVCSECTRGVGLSGTPTFGWYMCVRGAGDTGCQVGGKQTGTGQNGKDPTGVYDFGSPIGTFEVT